MMLLHHAHRACTHFWWKSIRFLVHGSILSEFGYSSIPGAIQKGIYLSNYRQLRDVSTWILSRTAYQHINTQNLFSKLPNQDNSANTILFILIVIPFEYWSRMPFTLSGDVRSMNGAASVIVIFNQIRVPHTYPSMNNKLSLQLQRVVKEL